LKWIKDGKRLITGTNTGNILLWNCQTFDASAHSLHSKQVTAIAVSKYDKYNISGDQKGDIVYSNAKLS
jgi:WD40 repeat protein